MSKDILRRQVYSILHDFPKTRNSDIELTIELWTRYYPERLFEKDGFTCIVIQNLFELPREDNIKRVRATIQNVDHEFLPTDIKIFIERARASDEWRKFLGYRINKLPEAMTDADLKRAIEAYLTQPSQTTLL